MKVHVCQFLPDFLAFARCPLWRGILGVVMVMVMTPGISLTAQAARMASADMVLRNGVIVTVEDKQPRAEALAIRDGLIQAVGSNEDIERFISKKTEVINLEGKLAIPGFIEGHAHFMGLGYSRLVLDLRMERSWNEIVEKVAREASSPNTEPGQWIVGRGWHQEKWDRIPDITVEGYPVHDDLSKATPHNPVILTHASGHAIMANALAMKLAGIDKHTKDPAGGDIVTKKDGRPTGILLDDAADPVNQAYENYRAARSADEVEKEDRKAARLAAEECLRYGITSFQDAGSSLAQIDLFRQLADEGHLPVRLWVMMIDDLELLREKAVDYKLIGYGNNQLTVRAIKAYMDGALGSRSAWLLEPYTDLPESVGLNTTPIEELQQLAKLALDNGLQICTHAIGDRANREVLDLYQQSVKNNSNLTVLRWRIEHAQHIDPADLPRFAQLGVIASMQAIHCTSDGPWVPKRLGPKRAGEGAYVWQKLLQSGARISNGTDAPVESVNPIANFHAAVTRKLPDGSVFYPDQRMTRQQALKSMTLDAAYAAFEEDIKGSLAPGKLADITVLSKNILQVSEEEIPKTETVLTIVGGKILYKKQSEYLKNN